MKTIEGYDVKIFTDNIEEKALEQIKALLSVEVFSDRKIRIMPDVHAGAGCVIGFTGDLGDRVIPNIVGVDIGCGMLVLNLGKLDDIDFHAFHMHILCNVPSGFAVREESSGFPALMGEEKGICQEAKEIMSQLICYGELKAPARLEKAIGTLGGGNHFIELDRDEGGNVYLVIHTGSRNLGKQVADIYQAMAGPSSALCYIEGTAREHYLHDMRLCQRWAALNRRLIARLLMDFFPGVGILEEFESVHNYIGDDNIIRKGAISAAKGERCIIPLNMRDGSLLCTGRGNSDWNCSAPHGAGRVLSRSQAYDTITMEDFKASMQGIYSESVTEFTLDESPMAYKPASEIMSNIGDTVTVDTIIRPVFNYKSSK